ncbi:MAG: hypothetical protein ABI696_00335 [Rubrivivax sp.]
MNPYVNPISLVAATPMTSQKSAQGSGTAWFEAMAQAWGQALDNQAGLIQQKSDAIAGGDDTPSAVTELTTESLRMSFLANSSHTSISTVGQALETMARKQ